MKKIYYASFFYAILGMIMGIVYRELTKTHDFIGKTSLSVVHTHIFVLGFFFFLLLLILAKLFSIHNAKGFSSWFIVYNVSFIVMMVALTLRGIYQIYGGDFAGLPHIAGLSHTFMLIAFIWFFIIIRKPILQNESIHHNHTL